jgi:threonine dehydrogenase-like Zn-dependent dehydrogenase
MRGLWLEAGSLKLAEDVPAPGPAPGEAVIRVLCAGICNTDLELVRGYYPFAGIPGHEFVGRVVSAPGMAGWIGKRVVGEINAACGSCDACRAGRRTHCENRSVLGIKGRHGAFAELLTLPVANLHEVPDGIPDEIAVFTEPTAAALEVQEQVRIGPTERVVVIGDGKLGQLLAQTLALTGCDLFVVGRHPAKLERLSARGIRGGVAAEVVPRRADVAVECTGNAEGIALALRAVRPRGTVVLKSTYRGEATLAFSPIVVDEISLVGSRCGPFEPAMALLSQGRIEVASLVDARYPLVDAVAAFEHAARPGVMKVLVSPSPAPSATAPDRVS